MMQTGECSMSLKHVTVLLLGQDVVKTAPDLNIPTAMFTCWFEIFKLGLLF